MVSALLGEGRLLPKVLWRKASLRARAPGRQLRAFCRHGSPAHPRRMKFTVADLLDQLSPTARALAQLEKALGLTPESLASSTCASASMAWCGWGWWRRARAGLQRPWRLH